MWVSLAAIIILFIFFLYVLFIFFMPGLTLLITGLIIWFCWVKLQSDWKDEQKRMIYLLCLLISLFMSWFSFSWQLSQVLWALSFVMLATVLLAQVAFFVRRKFLEN